LWNYESYQGAIGEVLTCKNVLFLFANKSDIHTLDVCLGEQGGGRCTGGGRRGGGSGTARWREAGEKGKNYATLRNISQSKKCKGAGAKKYRVETGIKGYEKREV